MEERSDEDLVEKGPEMDINLDVYAEWLLKFT
jgi:hypothetical protein